MVQLLKISGEVNMYVMRANEKKALEVKKNPVLENELGRGKFDKQTTDSVSGNKKIQKETQEFPQAGGKENKNQPPYLDVESFIMG